jgi:hypothetical protein
MEKVFKDSHEKVMRMTLRNRCVLTMSRTRHKSDPHHLKHRLIRLKVDFGKTNSVHLEWQLQTGRHLWLLIWRRGRKSLCCSWITDHGQDVGKHIEVRNEYRIADLWWQMSLHRWWKHIQETQVPYGGLEVSRRQGEDEMVVMVRPLVSLMIFTYCRLQMLEEALKVSLFTDRVE